MHTAQLDRKSFRIELRGQDVGLNELLPEPDPRDRFGIVVNEPFGALGASLLIQAAIVAFYDARPARRKEAPQYPEIRLFHVGGPHGDHSMFDFWPPRKEVFVEPSAYALLAAINEQAITRIAVPDGVPHKGDFSALQPSGWTEHSSFHERIQCAFAYSASGRVTEPDVFIDGDSETEVNASTTLDFALSSHFDPEQEFDAFLAYSEGAPAAHGPLSMADNRVWLARVAARRQEVSKQQAQSAAQARRAVTTDGTVRESYRTISTEEALGLLAAVVAFG